MADQTLFFEQLVPIFERPGLLYVRRLERALIIINAMQFKIYIKDVIECIQGKHTDVVRVQKAFLIFRTKFQKHQDKNNAAFRLKNLLILDRCTEEKCILDMIANYEYNRLFYDRNKADSSMESNVFTILKTGQFNSSYVHITYTSGKKQTFTNVFLTS